MTDRPADMTPKRRSGVALGWFVSVSLVLVMALSVIYSREVLTDLAQLQSADSDNVHWTLTQAEVEYLAFINALNAGTPETADLDQVREKYDIFYSRLSTLQNARLFRDLTSDPTFDRSLRNLTALINEALVLIDGPDDALRAAIPDLLQKTQEGRSHIRALSVSGLAHFARRSDVQREEIARTLSNLALATATLLVLLTALSIYLLIINRQSQNREVALQQANQRMHTILDTSLDGVIVVDSDGRVVEFNSSAEKIFGHELADVKGRTVGDILVPDHLIDDHLNGMKRVRAGGERHVIGKGRVTLEAKRANGDVFPIELAVQSAWDGKTQIFIAFIRDISQRIADEQELVRARDQALAGEKAKAEFLTVMSHEIRTPLNGLLGNLSLLNGTGLTPEQRQFQRNMEVSGRILLKHVDSVLDIAKFEAGKLQIAEDRVNLSELLQNLADGQRGNATNRGNVIEWCWVGPEQKWVLTDAQRVYQILLNLVGNAIKFTEFGRISIEAEVDCLPLTKGRKTIEFRVSDTGLGIADNQTEAIFEDFHTNDSSFGRATGGAGLGLGIARRIVEAMEGEIGVESVVDEGSTFWVRLPMRPAPALKSPKAKPDTTGPMPQLDILVVEDNEINLQVARSMLRREGHKVTSATDGQSGVDVAGTRRFDLIFMDISMPILDGLQATRLIRSGDGPSRKSPIIALSANVLPQDKERFLDAGMDAFLGKPLTQGALRRALYTVRGGRPSAPLEQDTENTLVDTDQLSEMRANMGDDTLALLLDRFVAEADELIVEIRDTTRDQDDLAAFGARCHKIAGSAAVFGATEFRALLNAMERAAQRGEHGEMDAFLRDIGPCWHRTRTVLTA